MDDAYENALRTVADSYEAEVGRWGGKSLSRVATIVVSSGAFFKRLRSGATFSVSNLDKFAAWFRDPRNWPDGSIPDDAQLALVSMGRPSLNVSMPQTYRTERSDVVFDPRDISQGAVR